MQRHLVLVCVAAALVGCGGAEPQAATGSTTAPERTAPPPRRNVDLDAYPYIATIPLRNGEIIVATNSLSDPEVVFALRAEVGDLAMTACDYLEAQADEEDVEIGYAEHRRVRGREAEELVAVTTREALEKVAGAERARLVTCHELLDLDDEVRRRLGAFLSGEDAPERAVVHSRTITLVGGTLSVAYRSDDPENIRFEIHLEGREIGACPRMALRAGSRTAEMHPPEGEHAPGVFFTTRAALRPIVSQDSARLVACGHTYELQTLELEVIAALIGGS